MKVSSFHNDELTLIQFNNIHDTVIDIIDNFDDIAIKELMSGDEKDIDTILGVFLDETYKAFYSYGNDNKVVQSTFDYLERVTSQFDESMMILSMNYFITSVLPTFELAPHIIEWCNLIQLYQYLSVIAARDHSKSYTFSFAQILWKMYRYTVKFAGKKNLELQMCREGMIVTNEYSLAKHLLGMVKEEIENNDILRERLYPNNRDGWGKESLKAKNGSLVYIKSYGSKIRGYHPTYAVIDDFLNETVLYSAEQNKKYISYFNSVIMNAVSKAGQVSVVGTPFVVGDLYDHLKTLSDWFVFEYPAIFPDGTILWESENTYDSLMKLRKRIGSLNFSREILVRAISEMSSVLTWDQVQKSFVGMEKYKLVSGIRNHKKKDDFIGIAVGCDFALSASADADRTVFMVVGIDEAKRIWLLHVFRGRGIAYSEQVAIAQAINSDFSPDIFIVETNGAQKIFADMMSERGMPVVEHHTGVEKNSLIEGVPALSVLFDNDQIKLPRGDDKSIEITDLLGTQLTSFTYDEDKGKLTFVIDHDDEAMAFWQACRGARYLSSGGFSFSFID